MAIFEALKRLNMINKDVEYKSPSGMTVNERKVPFKGTKTDQLYRIVKDNKDALIFANDTYYSINVEEMLYDLQDPVITGMDDDGAEFEINVSDIEFIELFKTPNGD